jgi:hypothetical protein
VVFLDKVMMVVLEVYLVLHTHNVGVEEQEKQVSPLKVQQLLEMEVMDCLILSLVFLLIMLVEVGVPLKEMLVFLVLLVLEV